MEIKCSILHDSGRKAKVFCHLVGVPCVCNSGPAVLALYEAVICVTTLQKAASQVLRLKSPQFRFVVFRR